MKNNAYTWSLVSYASMNELDRLFSEAKHYAYCHHDRDKGIDKEGNEHFKEPHTHILVTFEYKKSLATIQNIINSTQNTFGECERIYHEGDKRCTSPLNIGALWRYLIHADDPNKVQYGISERQCDNLEYWTKYDKTVNKQDVYNDDEFFDDLLSDNFSLQLMGRKYGRDFIKNANKYIEYRLRCLYEIGKESCDELETLADERVIGTRVFDIKTGEQLQENFTDHL